MGLIKGILKEAWSFFVGLLKQWLGYIFQATGVVAAVVFSPYVQYGADIRQDVVIFIYAYIASVIILRIAFRDSRWSIQYAQQFFRFVKWFLAVLASIIAPFVPGFLPFLALQGIGIVPRLAISVLVLLLLLFIGAFLGLGELFRFVEDEWVKGFQKRYATPPYEAILKGEEFEHHQEPPPTRRESLRNWWEERESCDDLFGSSRTLEFRSPLLPIKSHASHGPMGTLCQVKGCKISHCHSALAV